MHLERRSLAVALCVEIAVEIVARQRRLTSSTPAISMTR
jgi:hypothetical protein